MELTREEEAVLGGSEGGTRQRMMELLVGLGTVFSASRLVPVASAQVSGASYRTIGRWGLEWLESLDGEVAVPTILNPVGMDRERWQEAGIPADFAANQEKILAVFRRLGVRLECTCTPYEILPVRFGEHLAWAESSAVVYANSAIGARTNREGGPAALAAAIIGKTPCYGLHLDRNREPQVVIRVEEFSRGLGRTDHYGALGYIGGKRAGNRVPFFRGIQPRDGELKAMGAAMAASGAVALFHVEGITPEAGRAVSLTGGLEEQIITGEEVLSLLREIPVEAVALGCPHCSAGELAEIASLLVGKRMRKPLLIFTSRHVVEGNQSLIQKIEASGARVYADTCMVVSPMMEPYSSIMVNSGKAFAYIPSMCGAMVRIGTLTECVEEAIGATAGFHET